MLKHQFRAALLVLILLFSVVPLSACGKKKSSAGESEESAASGPQIREVRITGANFYDYFDYKEYPNFATDEDGNINACNLSYGFSLREGLIAADDPEHPDTLQVSFAADGVSRSGEFEVNFQNLTYTGTVYSEEHEAITDTLFFWPKGGRTVSYPYGTLSSSYIIRLEGFTVTSVSGSVFLRVG